MEKGNSNIAIINFSAYSKPEIVETTGRKWVSYGKDNDYFQYLIDRSNGSPTNNAIIGGISAMIYGKGLSSYDASGNPTGYAQMKKLFKKDDMRKISYDLKLSGNYALQIIYSKDRTQIVEVAHIPIETLRAERVGEDGEIEGYYYSKDWTKSYGSYKPVRIPAFGTSKESLEILYVKPYKPGSFYYSPPDYQGAVTYAEIEEEIANYHITNIQNGFSPTTLINFNNGQVTTEEEKREIEKKVYQKFSGTGGNKILLSFNQNAEVQTQLETVQLSDAHEQYQFLSDEASKKILIGHRGVNGTIFGIEGSTTGFSNNAEELKNSVRWLQSTVIEPFQDLIIEGLDKILEYNGISLDLYFISNEPQSWLETKDEIEKSMEGSETEEIENV